MPGKGSPPSNRVSSVQERRASYRRYAQVSVTVVALVTIAMVSACSTARDSDGAASPSTFPAQLVTRPSCEVPLPAAWQQAIADSGIDTDGPATVLAVGPTGEIAAVRDDGFFVDNGIARDLLLIAPDRSVTKVYSVPDPVRDRVGFATVDDRWIVVGVQRAPRIAADAPHGTNTALPILARVDIIDRRDRSVRTAAATTEADYLSGGATIDSIALFADTVYWITRDSYPSYRGTLRSYDLGTGAVTVIESGAMRDVQATAVGIRWWSTDGSGDRQLVQRDLANPPDPIDAMPGIADDLPTLAVDGTNYAWITGITKGGNGIASWSPDAGLHRISTARLHEGDGSWAPTIFVDGPYVILDRVLHGDGAATVVDTRSGAITTVDQRLVAAGGGTLAAQIQTPANKWATPVAGMVRTATLPALSC